MKKNSCIFFAVVFVLGLFMVTASAQAAEAEAPKIQFSGLIEVGGVWQDIDYKGAGPTEPEDESDLCLTTVELTAEAEVNEWVNVAATLLYEDPTFGEETSVDLDAATLTIGNTEEYPLYVSVGAMYVPFGALLTHFPDDPLVGVPLALLLGETREKAVLVGVEHQGFSASAYVFNGDVDEFGEENNVESYGVDANYSMDDDAGFELLVGASYISNLTDSDGLEEGLGEALGEMEAEILDDDPTLEPVTLGLKDYVAGAVGYVHVGFNDFFVDAEYMTALDELDVTGTTLAGTFEIQGVDEPAVWNVEVGYNLDWGKNLEIVLKYAGSDEAGFLGFPEERYGICLNQELYKDVIASLGYLNDDFENDDAHDRDDRDLVFAQIAIEF